MFLRYFAAVSALFAWIGAAGAVPVSVGSPVSGTYDISSFASPVIIKYEMKFGPGGPADDVNPGEALRVEIFDAADTLVNSTDWTNLGSNDAFSLSLPAGAVPIPETGVIVLHALSGFFEISGFDLIFDAAETSGNRQAVSLAPVSAVPLPAALPLMAGGFGVLALLGWRRRLAG